MLVTQCEAAVGRTKRIGFSHIIETALGMANVEAIAAASARNEALHFGVADYAASTRAQTTSIGGPNPAYAVLTDPAEDGARARHWGDMWHYALARMVVAARAHGLRPIDGPFGDYSDPEGYRAAAARAAALGCEGKWAIHPSQIALANEVMGPPATEVEKARRILAAMAQARKDGKGAVSLDGRLIDIASIRQAEALVAKADQIAARAG
jgi:malyl-CoA/(S)-citramalyl-CoA lyase